MSFFGSNVPFPDPFASDMVWRRQMRDEPFELKLPDPIPHDLAEVWDNAEAVVARTCQRCGRTFGPPQLVVHPDDERAFTRIAEREGLELIASPYLPRGKGIRMDPVTLDFLGCPGPAKPGIRSGE